MSRYIGEDAAWECARDVLPERMLSCRSEYDAHKALSQAIEKNRVRTLGVEVVYGCKHDLSTCEGRVNKYLEEVDRDG